jgi:hypothetical protein
MRSFVAFFIWWVPATGLGIFVLVRVLTLTGIFNGGTIEGQDPKTISVVDGVLFGVWALLMLAAISFQKDLFRSLRLAFSGHEAEGRVVEKDNIGRNSYYMTFEYNNCRYWQRITYSRFIRLDIGATLRVRYVPRRPDIARAVF